MICGCWLVAFLNTRQVFPSLEHCYRYPRLPQQRSDSSRREIVYKTWIARELLDCRR